MKYAVILGDGMSDYACEELGGKTPLSVAVKPNIDALARQGLVGLCKTVADGLKPGSDVANLSVLGYEPEKSYTGRSPIEAAAIGVFLKDTDLAMRANLVALSGDEPFEDKVMLDYGAGAIPTEDARRLIEFLKKELDEEDFTLYAAVAYRHYAVIANGSPVGDFTPPHDITGKRIGEYLSKSEQGQRFVKIMKKSYELLRNHPINREREKSGKLPANSLWFWAEGTKPKLANFHEKTGLKGAMISAVDLLNGIGVLTGMRVITVPGATGTCATNFDGKAEACLNALRSGEDFVYLHVDAPDECAHHGDAKNKVYAIEKIDGVVKKVKEGLDALGDDYTLLITPDHATPISVTTHVSDPVPFVLYRKNGIAAYGADKFDEASAAATGLYLRSGAELFDKFIGK